MGEMRLLFDEPTHTYTLGGEALPSVTHIIRFLSADVDKSRPWIRDEAARRGTLIHQACALVDYGEDDVMDLLPYELHGYLMAYLNFLRDNRCDWKYIELPDWCEYKGTRYAGTVDRYGTMNGVPALLDIKTGAAASKAQHAAQLTGYRNFPGIDPDCFLYILYLKRDGTYRLVSHVADEELFDACLTMHKKTGGKK